MQLNEGTVRCSLGWAIRITKDIIHSALSVREKQVAQMYDAFWSHCTRRIERSVPTIIRQKLKKTTFFLDRDH